MKKLLINPKKKDVTDEFKILNFSEVLENLMLKVFQQPENNFKPLVTKDGHIRRFISNVDPVLTSIQDYAGKELFDFQEAAGFINKMGASIYKDDQWYYKLIINEVKYGRDKLYALEAVNDTFIEKIIEGLEGIASVEYNKSKKTKPEKVTETETVITAQNEQENTNE